MNKRRIKWLSLILSMSILTGCSLFNQDEQENVPDQPPAQVEDPADGSDEGEPDTNEETEEDVNQDVAAWIPRVDNVFYSYVGDGNEYATFTSYPQFNQDDYYQVATDNGGTVLVEVYQYLEDEIIRTFKYPEAYFKDNFTEIGSFTKNQVEETVLKAPIAVGTSWTSDEISYEITATQLELTVPAGTYETIEITGTLDDGSLIKRYYAEGVGLVSEVSEGEGFRVVSNLESIEEDAAERIPFTVYVADDQAMGMDTVETELSLQTNDPARLAIQELLTGQNDMYSETNILPEGTQIQYLFLNDNQVVEVDVSEEFVSNMNAGSTGELFFIYNLVNTLSQYYGTNEVLLTVEGEPYQGAHMILDEGETLSFNQEMVNE